MLPIRRESQPVRKRHALRHLRHLPAAVLDPVDRPGRMGAARAARRGKVEIAVRIESQVVGLLERMPLEAARIKLLPAIHVDTDDGIALEVAGEQRAVPVEGYAVRLLEG